MSDSPSTQSDQSGPSGAQTSTDSNAGINTPSPAPAPQAQPQSHSTNPNWEAFQQTLTALPELIAKSVKEAIGTPQQPAKTQEKPAEESKQESTKPAETKETPAGKPGWKWDGGKGWFAG